MTVSPLRIRWLAVVTVLAIAVVLSACSADPAPTPEPTATPTAAPTNTPHAGANSHSDRHCYSHPRADTYAYSDA